MRQFLKRLTVRFMKWSRFGEFHGEIHGFRAGRACRQLPPLQLRRGLSQGKASGLEKKGTASGTRKPPAVPCGLTLHSGMESPEKSGARSVATAASHHFVSPSTTVVSYLDSNVVVRPIDEQKYAPPHSRAIPLSQSPSAASWEIPTTSSVPGVYTQLAAAVHAVSPSCTRQAAAAAATVDVAMSQEEATASAGVEPTHAPSGLLHSTAQVALAAARLSQSQSLHASSTSSSMSGRTETRSSKMNESEDCSYAENPEVKSKMEDHPSAVVLPSTRSPIAYECCLQAPAGKALC